MSVTRGVGSMSESEVINIFATNKAGVLCLEDGDKPYAVPLVHYFNGKDLYFATNVEHGYKKIACIKNNSNACYLIYDSRRDHPDLVTKGIRCRSVSAEGLISLAGIKEIDIKATRKVKLQMLKLEVKKIDNWKCPGKGCDWNEQWFEMYPHLVADL